MHFSVAKRRIVGYGAGALWELLGYSISWWLCLDEFIIIIGHFCYKTMNSLWPSASGNRLISQIPQCTSPISHNAPFCNRNVHISITRWCNMHFSVAKRCIVGNGTGALWDFWGYYISWWLPQWVHNHVCTFLLQNGGLWDVGLVHCGICEVNLLGQH